MDNSILRNVKNISRIALYTISIGIAALTAITLLNGLLDGYGVYGYIKENLQFYLNYMCIFSMFMFNITLSMTYAPIILSFCSRRRDYLTAKYLINAVLIVILLGIKLCMDIYKGGYKSNSMILTASALAALFGVANILGIVITKYGRIGYIIFVFICGICGGVIGFLISAAETGLFSKLISMGAAVLPAALVFMVISMVMESRIVMKSDIKR